MSGTNMVWFGVDRVLSRIFKSRFEMMEGDSRLGGNRFGFGVVRCIRGVKGGGHRRPCRRVLVKGKPWRLLGFRGFGIPSERDEGMGVGVWIGGRGKRVRFIYALEV